MENKKFYWLKLKRDFFKRHDIRIVEDMPNGKDYILFYLKLLVESVDHNGELRFSETIPYNEQMLSTITNTNLDIVRAAMKVFASLDMIEVIDDGTIYLTQVMTMIGSAADNDNANRQRRFREKQKQAFLEDSVTKSNVSITEDVTNDNESKRKSIELERDKEIDKEIDREMSASLQAMKPAKPRFTPPTLEQVQEYCEERNNDVDPQRFIDFYSSKGWMVGKTKMVDWKACVRTWEKKSNGKPISNTGSGNPFTKLREEEGYQ